MTVWFVWLMISKQKWLEATILLNIKFQSWISALLVVYLMSMKRCLSHRWQEEFSNNYGEMKEIKNGKIVSVEYGNRLLI